jgi:tetratricopeptide (TPR) repeat protein
VAATDIDGKFLEIVPPEVGEVLDWYAAEHARQAPAAELSDFAGKFLVAMLDDGAVFPASSAVSTAQTLALVLVHHQNNSEDPGAWLNLGIALRRMALYRSQDAEPVNRRRLQLALEAFDRSLRLQPDNIVKNVRAWTGKAFTYHQLGSYHEEVSCCARALDSDSSDPRLWLFYGFALKAAGMKSEALSVMDNAYEAYLAAGEPEDLRDVFAGVRTALPRC